VVAQASLPLSTNGLFGLPHHDVHSDILLPSPQIYVLHYLEAHLSVNDGINVVRALQIACSALFISLDGCTVSDKGSKYSYDDCEMLTLSVMCSTSFRAYPLPRLANLVPM
jgi:hypothetical protein